MTIGILIFGTISSLFGFIGLFLFAHELYQKFRKSNEKTLLNKNRLSKNDKDILRERFQRLYLMLVAFSIVIVLLLVSLIGTSLDAFSYGTVQKDDFLARKFPKVFRFSPNGEYELTRVFATREVLISGSRLRQTFSETEFAFDMFALNGRFVVRTFKKEILEAIRRGVDFRFVFLDYNDPATRPYYEALVRSMKKIPHVYAGEAQIVRQELVDLEKQIKAAPLVYKGSLRIRWLNEPLHHSIWIKDRGKPNRQGHLSVYVYKDDNSRPSFRASAGTAPMFIDTLSAEFEEIWSRSSSK